MADEGMELIPENVQAELDAKAKDINKRILEKAASDDDFRGHLMENPDEALQKAGFSDEIKNLATADEGSEDSDVEGHYMWRTRRWWQYGVLWHWR